jgi:ABC-type dipeptide/oligopeptide/nickel transport system permease component
MFTSLVKRFIQTLPVLIGLVTIMFFLQRLIPGSPADIVLGVDASPAAKAEWLEKYGFHKNLFSQYISYLWGILHGDFGRTYANFSPVFDSIRPRLWNTASLALTSFVCSLVAAMFIGTASSYFAGKFLDKFFAVLSLLAVSAPAFVLGPIVMWIFSVKLDWFPLTGNESLLSYVLPSFTLGLALAAYTSRMIRAGLVDVQREDYMRTARAKGLSKFSALVFHGMRNAFLPTLTVLGLQLGVLLSGAIITEQIFSWPGLGSLTLEAVQSREYNLVSACVIVMALVYVASNFLVDILYRVFDPRIR